MLLDKIGNLPLIDKSEEILSAYLVSWSKLISGNYTPSFCTCKSVVSKSSSLKFAPNHPMFSLIINDNQLVNASNDANNNIVSRNKRKKYSKYQRNFANTNFSQQMNEMNKFLHIEEKNQSISQFSSYPNDLIVSYEPFDYDIENDFKVKKNRKNISTHHHFNTAVNINEIARDDKRLVELCLTFSESVIESILFIMKTPVKLFDALFLQNLSNLILEYNVCF